ncbi:MAG: ABC transporter substrate-binding protein [Paracoccaceae bacterium]
MSARVETGFLALLDAVVPVVARDMGFAAEEGVDLVLRREPSWSNVRDKVAIGLYPCAQMLAPMPLAMTLGAGAMRAEVIAPMVLATGGGTVGVSAALDEALGRPAWGDALGAGRALLGRGAERPVGFGVPFPHSMHHELVRYWLRACGGRAGADQAVVFQTVPPPLMAEALAAGQIDAFCVGEPWGSVAVERGQARLVMPTAAIWAWAPEKVLGVRRDWAEAEPGTLARLMRALHRAGLWVARAENAASAAEMLESATEGAVPALIAERSLSGTLTVDPAGSVRRVERFLGVGDVETMFPWRSQALWIAEQVAHRWGVLPHAARTAALACFRPDLYRAALEPLGVDLPGASAKLEGALAERTGVASAQGALSLGPDRFFDGRTFDPRPYLPIS